MSIYIWVAYDVSVLYVPMSFVERTRTKNTWILYNIFHLTNTMVLRFICSASYSFEVAIVLRQTHVPVKCPHINKTVSQTIQSSQQKVCPIRYHPSLLCSDPIYFSNGINVAFATCNAKYRRGWNAFNTDTYMCMSLILIVGTGHQHNNTINHIYEHWSLVYMLAFSQMWKLLLLYLLGTY